MRILLLVCLPFLSMAQQPIQTSLPANSQPSSDIAALTASIKEQSVKLKELMSVLQNLREQIQVLSDQKQNLENQLAKKKKERDQLKNDDGAISKLDREIGELETLISTIEKKMEGLQRKISQQSSDILKIQQSIDKLQSKLESAKQQDKKKAKEEAVSVYARVKIILDSLTASEKAKLTGEQTRVFNFFKTLYTNEVKFRNDVDAIKKQQQLELVDNSAEDAKDQNDASKERLKAALKMLMDYYERLAELQSRILS